LVFITVITRPSSSLTGQFNLTYTNHYGAGAKMLGSFQIFLKKNRPYGLFK